MSDTFSSLYDDFKVYLDGNDEEGARRFLIDNFAKFPEEVQEKLTFAFFEEALKGKVGVAKMREAGIDAIDQIDKAKGILEDKAKIESLRSDLNK